MEARVVAESRVPPVKPAPLAEPKLELSHHATSVSQGRSSPRRLSRSVRAKAAVPLPITRHHNERCQDRLRFLEAHVDFPAKAAVHQRWDSVQLTEDAVVLYAAITARIASTTFGSN